MFRRLSERASPPVSTPDGAGVFGAFGLGDIRERVRIIRDAPSVDEGPVVDALVGISSALYAAQHAEKGTASRRDLHVTHHQPQRIIVASG